MSYTFFSAVATPETGGAGGAGVRHCLCFKLQRPGGHGYHSIDSVTSSSSRRGDWMTLRLDLPGQTSPPIPSEVIRSTKNQRHRKEDKEITS